MRQWSRFFLRPLMVSLFIPVIGLLTPVAAYGFNAFHPVTFNENDSLTDKVNTYQTLNAPADITLSSLRLARHSRMLDTSLMVGIRRQMAQVLLTPTGNFIHLQTISRSTRNGAQ